MRRMGPFCIGAQNLLFTLLEKIVHCSSICRSTFRSAGAVRRGTTLSRVAQRRATSCPWRRPRFNVSTHVGGGCTSACRMFVLFCQFMERILPALSCLLADWPDGTWRRLAQKNGLVSAALWLETIAKRSNRFCILDLDECLNSPAQLCANQCTVRHPAAVA